jgi:type III secretory pathway component EscS
VLKSYRLDNPATDEVRVLSRRAYFWGALGGPLYLVANRLYSLAIVMLLIMAGIAAGAIVGLTFSVYLFDSSLPGLVTMLAIVTSAFALNGIVAVRLVRYGYRRRGWEEYRA